MSSRQDQTSAENSSGAAQERSRQTKVAQSIALGLPKSTEEVGIVSAQSIDFHFVNATNHQRQLGR